MTAWDISEDAPKLLRTITGPEVRDPAGVAFTTASQIDRAWQLALGRLPTVEEKAEAAVLLNTLSVTDPQTSWSLLCLALFNMQEFVYVD